MELCSDGHDEICYVNFNKYGGHKPCPVCQMLEEKQDEIDVLNEKIIDLEDKIENK